MSQQGSRSRLLKLSSASLAIAGVVSLSLPVSASVYRVTRVVPRVVDYQTCADQLLNAGIADSEAASACARALYPDELSFCVTQIDENTDILASDAFSGCRRVRRPLELSTCVVDINAEREDAVASGLLDYCRRSFTPIRFSHCVLGVGREVEFSTAVVMETCISADNRPQDVLPSFIPAGSPAEIETEPFQFTPINPEQY